jgi:hypothetical protein
MGSFDGSDEMLHEYRVGHDTHAARHGRQRGRHVGDRRDVHVPNDPALHHVDPAIHDDSTQLQHVARHEARRACRHHQDLGLANLAREVARLPVTDSHRGTFAKEQQGSGFANHVAAPDHDRAPSGNRDPGRPENLEGRFGTGGNEPVKALGDETGIQGMDAVEVLGRIDRVRDLQALDVRR